MNTLQGFEHSGLDQSVGGSDIGSMPRQLSLSESLRKALHDSGQTVYAVSRDTGIPMTSLHRFWHGEGSMRLASADLLATHLGVRLVQDKRRKR